MKSAIIFGGYGTFGALVARELAKWGVSLTIAGRDQNKALAFAHELGPNHQGIAADLENPGSLLQKNAVAVNCVGPLLPQNSFLNGCLNAGCHYVDIAVERTHAAGVRALDDSFRERGLAAVYGCSSLPALSGALALKLMENQPTPAHHVRVTLFIGNSNRKGLGAIRSLVSLLGRPIQAPQGLLYGFRDRETAPLPEPFGPRLVFNFDSPEYDLFPDLLGARSVSVKVGFESRLGTTAISLLARLGSNYGVGAAKMLEWVGGWFGRFGSSGGAVLVEFFWPESSTRRAALVAKEHGQRMAALPCALVARELCGEGSHKSGVMTGYEFLGAQFLLESMTREGFEVREEGADPE